MARPSGRGGSTASTGFTPEQLQALSGLVERSTYKKKLEQAQPSTPWFKKLFSFLSTGESSSAVYAALEGKNPLEEYGKNIIRDIQGKGYDDKTYADVLEKIGMPKLQLSQMMPWAYSDTGQGIKLKKDGFLDISGRGVAGLAGDIFLNPTTYLTGGGLFAQGGKAKNLTKEGMALANTAQATIDDLVKAGGDDVAKQVFNVSDDLTRQLNKNKDLYYTGIKFMGQEVLPRKVALAPGRLLDKTFSNVPILNQVYTGAKTGIQDMFKYGADVIRNGGKYGDVGMEQAQSYLAMKQILPKRQKELIDGTYTKLKDLHKIFKANTTKNEAGLFNREEFAKFLTKNMEGELDNLGIAVEAKGDFVNELVNGFKEFNTGFATAENKAIGKLEKDPLETISNYVFHMPSTEGRKLLAGNKKLSFQGRAISTGANSDKERVFSKFVDANGVEVIAKPRAMGWKPFNKKVEENAITKNISTKSSERVQKTALEKLSNLPKSDLWWVDKDGKEYTRIGTATIGDVNKVMEKTMLENGFKGNFLETDPFAITYGRGALSANKIASNEFYNSVLNTFGKTGEVYEMPYRNSMTRTTSVKKAVMEDVIDGIRYVDPGINVFPEGTLLPDFIVSDLQKTKKLFDDEEIGNKLLRGYDKIINEWKGSVYGWYPASHGRNLIGALYNNWLAGLNPLDSAYKEGVDIVRGKDGFITTSNGLKISYDTIRKEILAKGVTGQSGMLDAVRFYKEFDPSNFHKLRNLPVSAMEAVENNVRTPLFVKALKDGGSFDDAAKTVFKYHFDYAPEALTTFEKTVLRRVIPFYRWTRGNIPLMLEQMIAQPGKFNATFRALQQASDKNGKVQMDLLPGYMQNDVSITKGGDTISGLGIPPVQMFQYMKEPVNQFLSGMTPFIKIPVELKTGFNTFKEKAILDDDSGTFADKYPQALKDWLQYDQKEVTKKDGTKFTITTVDPMRKYWLYALPTGRLASIFSSTMGEDEKNKLLYNISGIKSFRYDMQRLKDTQEANFEKAITDILIGEGIMGEIPYIFKDSKEAAGLAKPKKRKTSR